MASNTQGIMALPETDEASVPTLALDEAYGAAKQGLTEANPEYTAMYDEAMSQVMPALMALSDSELDIILQMIQYLRDNPDQYEALVKELETDGSLEKGSLPETYDENFLAVFGAAVLEAQRTNADTGGQQAAMQPPMQLAKGGIAEAARMVAGHGRTGDTMLAHINKDEAKLLRKHGGMGTINPRTGLPEYGLWSSFKSGVKSVGKGFTSAVKTVGGGVKAVLASPVGRIAATVALATFIGPAALGLTAGSAGAIAAQYGLASAGVAALSGSNLKDVLKAGVTGAVAGYGGAALGPALGSVAAGAGATATGMGLIQGKSVKDAVKEGLTSAAIAGAMSYANDSGISRGATRADGVNPADVPVDERSFNAPTSTAQAQQSAVQPGTQATAIQPGTQATAVTPQPLASSNAAFDQGLAANQIGGAQQSPANFQKLDLSNAGLNAGASPTVGAPQPLAASNQAFNQAMNTAGVGTPPPVAEPSWFDKNIMPSGIQQQGAIDANKAGFDAVQRLNAEAASRGMTVSPEMQNSAFNAAVKANTPGIMATYGPATGLTLAGVAALGGFKQQQPTGPGEEMQEKLSGTPGQDLIKANPKEYIPQNIPGISYSASGDILGGKTWNPYSTQPTVVAGNYIPYTPQRYYADGGYAGSAFGPTPLTMDQGPMMAQGASPVSMNTPGVPMNLPMGFAMGGMPPQGIASLAVGGYPRRTGQISGPGTEKSDSIPAMLSDGEFVMTAKAVRGAGKGNRMAGAKKMYALMHHLEKNAARG